MLAQSFNGQTGCPVTCCDIFSNAVLGSNGNGCEIQAFLDSSSVFFFPSLHPSLQSYLGVKVHRPWPLVPFWAAVSKAGFWGYLCHSVPPLLPASLHLLFSLPIPLPLGSPSSPRVREYLKPLAGPPSSMWMDSCWPWLAVPSLTSPADQRRNEK